jgi:hypothetical protein
MIRFKVAGLTQALAEAKVLHDVAEHGLILSRGAQGRAARGPTPSSSPRWPPRGH